MAFRCVSHFASLLIALLAVSNLASFGQENLAGGNASREVSQPDAQQLAFFEKEVRPLLVEHCYECHSSNSTKLKAGLRLDSRKGMLIGGDSGPALVPMNADASPLVQAVRYDGLEMPPGGKLPAKDIDVMARWVAMGAPWPEEAEAKPNQSKEVFDWEKRKANHWVWQPITNPSPPTVVDKSWPTSPIDQFIQAGLESVNLKPAAQADKYTLIRRLSMDLIGLPPTPEQVREYVSDTSNSATEKLVDRLLDLPQFGERWGRHWLDLVRFAESRGHEFDNDAPYAYQYRDYIIRALNADVPYDQLIREHIAGDLLPAPRLHPTEQFNESILGTGFWHLGEWVHSPVDIRKDESDRFDNMVDVMSKAFLGVTVSCARCHDHKFDAISTEDYYSLVGFLQSCDYREAAFDAMEQNRTIASQLEALDDRYRSNAARLMADKAQIPIDNNRSVSLEGIPNIDVSITGRIVADYGSIKLNEYRTDGELFGKRPRNAGEILLSSVGEINKIELYGFNAAATDPFWNAFKKQESNSPNQMSSIGKLPRSGRTLWTPTFDIRDGKVQCRVRGKGHIVACVDSHRLLAGPLHGETVVGIPKSETWQWVPLSLSRYVGHRTHLEFTPDVDASLEVQFVAQGLNAEELKKLDEVVEATAASVLQRSQQMELALQSDSTLRSGLDAIAENWAKERMELQKRIRSNSRIAMAMMDATGEDERVLIRGNSSNPGKTVPRRFLAAIDGQSPLPIAYGSGRLQLADRINGPSNPLTRRVMANRLWHHLMGRGIVPTTDDFGVLGQRPSHPELLDHLASQFQAQGQSIKKLIRYIVLSKTYQMDSRIDAESMQRDPNNQYWHHHPQKRLEGETIRDTLLSISGRLDPTMFGTSVPVHLSPFMDGRGKPKASGPLDGANRRSIYLEVRRNFLSPMFVAFDTPTPFSSMGRRNVSNVPAQALILLNDPLVNELAKSWAKRACEMVPSSNSGAAEARVKWMVMTAFSREASDAEIASTLQFLQRHANENGWTMQDLELWGDYAHALINKKEFVFQR